MTVRGHLATAVETFKSGKIHRILINYIKAVQLFRSLRYSFAVWHCFLSYNKMV